MIFNQKKTSGGREKTQRSLLLFATELEVAASVRKIWPNHLLSFRSPSSPESSARCFSASGTDKSFSVHSSNSTLFSDFENIFVVSPPSSYPLQFPFRICFSPSLHSSDITEAMLFHPVLFLLFLLLLLLPSSSFLPTPHNHPPPLSLIICLPDEERRKGRGGESSSDLFFFACL